MQTIFAVLLATLATLEGRVFFDGEPLPGCTVRWNERETVTDVDGRYAFTDVPLGEQTLTFELSGLARPRSIAVTVERARVAVPPVTLLYDDELPVFRCMFSIMCEDKLPEDELDLPACVDHEADLEAIASGSLAELRKRYGAARTLEQRHRLAAEILERDASAVDVWDATYAQAELAVEIDDEEDRRFRPALGALRVIANVPRARPLLERARGAKTPILVITADEAFAR